MRALLYLGGIFKEEILFRCKHFLCYERNENISPRSHPSSRRLKEEILLYAYISCVMQKTEIFHQGPPLTLVLLYCTFLIENHSVQFDGGRFNEEILCRCEHFLCYARNENFSPSPPSTLVLLHCKLLIEIHAVQLDS